MEDDKYDYVIIKREENGEESEEGRVDVGITNVKSEWIEEDNGEDEDRVTHTDTSYGCPPPDNSSKQLHPGIGDEVIYRCHVCTYTTTFSSCMYRHVRIHTKYKQYKCEQCDYSSGDSGNFKRHTRTHTKDKTYKCDLCDYSAIQSNNLKLHKRSNHGADLYQLGIPPQDLEGSDECTQVHKRRCDVHSIPDNSSKQLHPGIGDEAIYRCHVCTYTTRFRSHLHPHIRIHTKYKPYKCEQCDYSSGDDRNFKRHMRIHTKDKPYKCDLCEYSANQSNNLKLHKRSKHGADLYQL